MVTRLPVFGRKIICDVCGREIDGPRTSDLEPPQYLGMLSWLLTDERPGAKDFLVHHKMTCDSREDSHWMELNAAAGPHGLATLIHFMTEEHTDKKNLELLIHRLFFTEGRLDPPATAFDRDFDDKFFGRDIV